MLCAHTKYSFYVYDFQYYVGSLHPSPDPLSHPAPCLNGGVCASTSRGDFICTCPPGYDGVRCQYTDVCTSSAPCSSDEMCVETVTTSAGYVCVDVERMGEGVSVTVEGGGANTVTSSRLDGEVNSYIEVSPLLDDVISSDAERYFTDIQR